MIQKHKGDIAELLPDDAVFHISSRGGDHRRTEFREPPHSSEAEHDLYVFHERGVREAPKRLERVRA